MKNVRRFFFPAPTMSVNWEELGEKGGTHKKPEKTTEQIFGFPLVVMPLAFPYPTQIKSHVSF